jgi:hypothetical protein
MTKRTHFAPTQSTASEYGEFSLPGASPLVANGPKAGQWARNGRLNH